MNDPLYNILALHFLPGCGAATFWKLRDHFGSIDEALRQDSEYLKPFCSTEALVLLNEYRSQAGVSRIKTLIENELELCDKANIRLISANSNCYPNLLRKITRQPPILYVRGEVDILDLPQIAIVGSRKPTPTGQALAGEFAADLSQCGFTVTSGLALGIDAFAHRGALAFSGATVAVLGSGLLNVYPKRNQGLAEEIVQSGGALVSEFALNTVARPSHFPQRNRVVSGLSCGVLVVEAALKSGSLITARFALQQDREVFAIPGSIRSEVSRGCHAMIKSGAKLVETSKDIVQELSGVLGYYKDLVRDSGGKGLKKRKMPIRKDLQKVLRVIGYEEVSIEQITSITQKPTEQLSSDLMELELAGHIENTGLGFIKL